MGRPLPAGSFGENLTTLGADVNGARIGERWRVGDTVELAVTYPRIPCSTFRGWIAKRGWLKTFTAAALPGGLPAGGAAGAGPGGLLPLLLTTDDLPADAQEMARAGQTFSLG